MKSVYLFIHLFIFVKSPHFPGTESEHMTPFKVYSADLYSITPVIYAFLASHIQMVVCSWCLWGDSTQMAHLLWKDSCEKTLAFPQYHRTQGISVSGRYWV